MRLTVFRTNLHIYASVILATAARSLATASTAEKEVRDALKGLRQQGWHVAAATLIGKRIAEKAKAAGVEKVAFDRAGFAVPRSCRRPWLTQRVKQVCSSKRSGAGRNFKWLKFQPKVARRRS